MLRVGVVRRGLGLAPRAVALNYCPRCPAVNARFAGGAVVAPYLDDKVGPPAVQREEPLLEMGVLYPAGVPSPSESIDSIPPIVVHGTIAKCDGGGGPLGHPVEYIRLPRCAAAPAPARDSAATRFWSAILRRNSAALCRAIRPRNSDAPPTSLAPQGRLPRRMQILRLALLHGGWRALRSRCNI